ncbi:hypothetical protein HUO13_11920 [Saccharopolyspora erythraea]|uniref:hypothetical protein n=1 Tax=Saccharopolyspora erythraea TaxID=1836 RepID=UPI001BA9399F|nr:hypothetical protein [Saccharopolyspora erythraea]QUH01422.1 hypothetical protein HUO13_11920 [Saccharopolyspora erythraea]
MTNLDDRIRERIDWAYDEPHAWAHDVFDALRAVLDLCNELEATAPNGFAEFISGATALRFKTAIARALGVEP